MVLLLWSRLIADDGFVRLRPNSAPANLSGLHTTCVDAGGIRSTVGSAARNGHASAHNNQLQLSERDKKIVDDLPRMEDGEKIREAAGESIER